jgi:hypothetical protein
MHEDLDLLRVRVSTEMAGTIKAEEYIVWLRDC